MTPPPPLWTFVDISLTPIIFPFQDSCSMLLFILGRQASSQFAVPSRLSKQKQVKTETNVRFSNKMSRLTSTDIFYLDLEETQPFQDVRIKSATGTTVFLSKLYLASLSPMLKAFLSCDPEEATIVTNFNHQDLEIVSKFCSQGVLPTSINELEAGALFRCFGISLVDELFKNESLKIEDDFDYNYTKPKFVPEEVKSEPLEETLSHREVDEDDYSSQFEDSEDEPILSKSRKRKYSTTEKTTQLLSKYNNYKEVQEKYKDYLRVTIPNLGEPEDVKFTNYKPLQPLDEFWKPPRAPSRKKKKPAGYEDYPLNCKLCSKRFTSDILKAFHIKVYHNSHYQCPYCPNAFYQDEAFKFKKHLYKHEHVTKTAIPHECIQCGKTDFCLQRLQKHIDNFRGPFHNNQCTQCHERFSSHEEYRSHVDKAHYGIWKFRCDDCEKVFDTLQLC